MVTVWATGRHAMRRREDVANTRRNTTTTSARHTLDVHFYIRPLDDLASDAWWRRRETTKENTATDRN